MSSAENVDFYTVQIYGGLRIFSIFQYKLQMLDVFNSLMLATSTIIKSVPPTYFCIVHCITDEA